MNTITNLPLFLGGGRDETPSIRRCVLILLLRNIGAMAALVLVQPATAAPLYNIVPLGLDDPEHTQSDGYRFSAAGKTLFSPSAYLNEAGQVYGYSGRFNGGSADLGYSVWLFNGATTMDIGLTGSDHTRNDGYKRSEGVELNEAGQVSGYSYRYKGGSDSGRSAWLYDGENTIDVGLKGVEHTRNDGYRYSDSFSSYESLLNEAGNVVGISYRFNGGSSYLGSSAWLHNGAGTINIGLTGPEHTRNLGFKVSQAVQLNEAGQVHGYSNRYKNGSADLGRSTWLYNGTATIDIGLTDSEHTRNDGYKYSYANKLNQAGQVTGFSNRYNSGSVNLGETAWLYNGSTTVQLGLTDAEHTRSDGYKRSGGQLNEAGQVSGVSSRYNGSSIYLGETAWLYDGANAIRIGLAGVEHTRNDGYKSVYAGLMNEAGQVSGFSSRYNGGSADLGISRWLYNGANTVAIGLTGTEHTRNDGYKISYAFQLNEAGQVNGNAERFNGSSTFFGSSAWLYNGATTIDVGLTSVKHTRNDGYKHSSAEELNEAGQVRGFSKRFSGGSTELGQDAWLYDSALDHTFTLQLSTRSDGYAYSNAEYLGDDGLTLGTYTLFDALDINLGNRAFYFTIADGLHDLGSLVEGGLAANGWDYLANAIRANGLGQILGHGKLALQSGGQMAYLLTPVPEPSTLALAVFGLIGLIARRISSNSARRKNAHIDRIV